MANKSSMSKELDRALRAVGGVASMAKLLGITTQAVGQWEVAPPNRVLKIEEATRGLVTRHDLRPDVFGAAPKQEQVA